MFDSVDHEFLTYKPQACHFYGNLWLLLTSYLENHQQFVKVNRVKSKLNFTSYGIPQGPLLGPRLFLIYVNNFANNVSMGELYLYADDTTTFVIGNTSDNVIQQLDVLLTDVCL